MNLQGLQFYNPDPHLTPNMNSATNEKYNFPWKLSCNMLVSDY